MFIEKISIFVRNIFKVANHYYNSQTAVDENLTLIQVKSV